MSFAPKQFIRSVDFLSTENAINTSTGCVNIYGGMSVSKDSYLTNMIVVGNSTVTNLNITGALITSTGNTLTSSQWTSIDSNSDIYFGTSANAFVGIGTTTPTFNLDISGGSRITGGLTVGNLNVNTGATITNILNTTICTGTTIVSGGITTSTIRVTGNADLSTGLTTVTDLTGTNITSATIRASTLISTANLGANNVTSGTIQASTLISTANLATNNFSSGTIRATTLITSANITANNFTANNLISSNITSSNLRVSGTINSGDITVGNINFTGSLYQNGSAYLGSQWTTTSGNTLTYTSGNVSINSGFSSTFNSNTLGNIFTTGGNVGIGIAPTSKLHVHASDFPNIKLTTDNVYVNSIDLDSTNKTGGVYWRLMSTHQNASEGQGKFVISQVTSGLDVLGLTSSGNVGIRTLNPSTTLDVSGTGRITTSLTTGALFSTNQTTTNIVGTNISTGTLNSTTVSSTIVSATTITGSNLSLSGNLNVAGTLTTVNITSTNLVNTNVSAGVVVASSLLSATGNSNTIGSIFTTGGNVGIGTTSPAEQLHVAGNILLRPNTFLSGSSSYIQFSDIDNGTGSMQIRYHDSGTAALSVMGGRLGIGTTSPNSSLDVTGSARFRQNNAAASVIVSYLSSATDYIELANANIGGSFSTSAQTGDGVLRTNKNLILQASGAGAAHMYIATSGNIGIGTTTPSFTLDVTGSGNFSTFITTGSLFSTHQTTTNIIGTNVSFTNLVVSNAFSASAASATLWIVNATNYVSTGTLNSTNQTTTNAVFTNLTTGITRITSTSATSMGTLTVAGPGSSAPATATSGQLASFYGPGGAGSISNIDLSTYQTTSAAMGLPSVRFSMTDLGANNSSFNILSKNSGSTGTMASRIFIDGSGNVGINTTNPSNTIDVSGTGRITTSLTTGALFSTNQTTTNIVGTNITTGGMNATGVINLLSSTSIQATTNNYSTTSGALNVSGDIVLSGTELMFTTTGIGAPTMNGRGSGSKIVLYPQTSTTQGDYSLGVEAANMWFQVPTTVSGYKFYQGTSANVVIATNGNLGINISTPTQSLEVYGNSYIRGVNNGGSLPSFGSRIAESGLAITWNSLPGTPGEVDFISMPGAGAGGGFNFAQYNSAGNVWSSTSGSLFRITGSGNVGISTTNPQTKLHIEDGSVFIGDVATGFSTSVPSNPGSTNVANGYRLFFDNSYNPTAGAGMPANKIVLHNNSFTAGLGLELGAVTYHSGQLHRFYCDANLASTYGSLALSVSSTQTLATTNTNGEGSLRIVNSNAGSSAYGMLRIGNNSGYAVMFINSSARTTDGGAGTLTIRNDAGSLRLQGAGATNTIFLPGSSTNVGINTTAPRSNLEITQTSSTTGMMLYSGSNDGGVNRIIFNHSDTSSNYQKVSIETQALGTSQAGRSNFSIRVNTANDNTNVAAGDTRFFIHGTSGNVGIMTTSPSYPLHVSGDIYATGDVISFSDARLKTDVQTINNALDKVSNMRGVYYTNLNTQTRETGVIAQEIMDVLPEVVADRGEYLGVAYGNIVGVLIEAIKELKAKVVELEARVN